MAITTSIYCPEFVQNDVVELLSRNTHYPQCMLVTVVLILLVDDAGLARNPSSSGRF